MKYQVSAKSMPVKSVRFCMPSDYNARDRSKFQTVESAIMDDVQAVTSSILFKLEVIADSNVGRSRDIERKFAIWDSIFIMCKVYSHCKHEILEKDRADAVAASGPLGLLVAAVDMATVLPQFQLRSNNSAYGIGRFLKERHSQAIWDAHETHNKDVARRAILAMSMQERREYVAKYEADARKRLAKYRSLEDKYLDQQELLQKYAKVLRDLVKAVQDKDLMNMDACKTQQELKRVADASLSIAKLLRELEIKLEDAEVLCIKHCL